MNPTPYKLGASLTVLAGGVIIAVLFDRNLAIGYACGSLTFLWLSPNTPTKP